MTKLILKNSKLQALNDSENINIGELKFEMNQFKIPKSMVVQKEGLTTRIVKEKNAVGELVETGQYNIFFEVYDRSFIELILENGGTEIGSPITIVVENQDSIPILDNYEDGEFIPITFEKMSILPKKIQKKLFVGQGKPMAESWVFDDVKVISENFVLGNTVENKGK
ncbi:peptidase [Enterococcus casseliflavus]|uniref:hypothetical protein n=1 Tax=Enterococcus casseliflavus TaxID=37734 RepID=UPI001FCC223A|nr:hypothetical protein [Enterococcus casseliflavus]MBO6386490.1 peptidase [Enterococcus casseliflavus]